MKEGGGEQDLEDILHKGGDKVKEVEEEGVGVHRVMWVGDVEVFELLLLLKVHVFLPEVDWGQQEEERKPDGPDGLEQVQVEINL